MDLKICKNCSKCFNLTANKPLNLPCGCTLCLTCSNTLTSNQSCPLCRATIIINDIDDIPRSKFLIEYLKSQQNDSNAGENQNVLTQRKRLRKRNLIEDSLEDIEIEIKQQIEKIKKEKNDKIKEVTQRSKKKIANIQSKLKKEVAEIRTQFDAKIKIKKDEIKNLKENQIAPSNINAINEDTSSIDDIEIKLEDLNDVFNNNFPTISFQMNVYVKQSNGDEYCGHLLNDKYNGLGVLKFNKNDEQKRKKYSGYFKDGKQEGFGILEFNDGVIYKGYFHNNEMHGRGHITNNKNYDFKGFFVKGMINGYGEQRTDGDLYVGEFKNNMRDGYGEYKWDDGNSFIGVFKEDFESFGTFYDKAKDCVYQGNMKENKFHGKGMLFYNQNKVSYIGGFNKNQFDGYGIKRENGNKFKGNWKKGKKSNGIYRFSSGDVYNGNFNNDEFHGSGTYRYANGEEYRGNWKNDKRHGYGRLENKNTGIVKEGNWQNDKFQGTI